MSFFRLLSAWLIVIGCCCCQPSQPSVPLSPDSQRLHDSLVVLRANYENLRLPESLVMAQRLTQWVESGSGNDLSPALITELYQYLAILLHEGNFEEEGMLAAISQSEQYLPQDTDPLLTARQMLCRAYGKYSRWEWLEMDMIAALGILTLEENDLSGHPLHASLLLARGFAEHHYSYNGLSDEDYLRVKRKAEVKYRAALRIFRERSSPRERQAWEELIKVYARVPEWRERIPAMIDSTDGCFPAAPTTYGRRNYLKAHSFLHRQIPDSILHYYKLVLEDTTYYRASYREEAYYSVTRAASALEDFPTALSSIGTSIAITGCGSIDDPFAGRVDPDSYTGRYICPYYQISVAEVYLDRYRARGDLADLRLAFEISQASLARYESSFPSYREEGTLNKLLQWGNGLLDVALESATSLAQVTNDPRHLDAVFASMELGKTLVLLREIDPSNYRRRSPVLNSLDYERADLKNAFRKNFSLPREKLRRYRRVEEAYAIEEAAQRVRDRHAPPSSDVEEATPTVAEVQRALPADRALIEFAGTAASLIVLYIDADTVINYRTPSGVAASIDTLNAVLRAEEDRSAAEYSALAFGLYRALLGPVADRLDEHPDLLIVPATGLTEFPFAALTVGEVATGASFGELDYLLDHNRVRYLPSWRVECRNAASRTLSDLTAPLAGAWTNGELNSYLLSLGEIVTSGAADDSRHYTNGEVSSADFLSQVGRYDVIHLSVHARGNDRQLNDNYFYLSPTDSINGTAITRHSLRARLVTLAACSTARGFVTPGEGTFSLRRSFHLAGVPDVVCSLFDISAPATAAVLSEFYEALYAGTAIDEALHRAQVECRRGRLATTRWVHPRSWAGLILG